MLALLVEYRVTIYRPYVWNIEYSFLQTNVGDQAIEIHLREWEVREFALQVQRQGVEAIAGDRVDEMTLSSEAADSSDDSAEDAITGFEIANRLDLS